jgi:hypothetical protein
MNVLLIHPKFPQTFWSFTYALPLIKKKSAFPPLGLLTVAALLPENWTKRLVDENIEEIRDEDLAWADMAFLGAMAVQRKSVGQIIARCKAMGLKIVAGGPLSTAEPDAFDFMQKSGIATAMVGLLQAPPGTLLFERLAREHRVSTEFSGDNVDGRTNIIPAMGLDNRRAAALKNNHRCGGSAH